jgi:hypothetical protein
MQMDGNCPEGRKSRVLLSKEGADLVPQHLLIGRDSSYDIERPKTDLNSRVGATLTTYIYWNPNCRKLYTPCNCSVDFGGRVAQFPN